MEEDLTFETIPAKFCGMVEQYRLELAKKNPIELQLDVSLPWKTICWIHETVLISKKFWFIKRLVDNDKIDFDNRDLKDEFMLEFERYPVFQGNTYNWDFNENGLLMLLAIQDDPISFLISVLK